MHNKQDITNIFKQELQNTDTPYSDALWSKLNDDLLPVRDKYKKQQRRRLAAYISLALLALSSVGGYIYYKNHQAKANKTCAILNTATPKGCCAKPTQADRFGLIPNIENGEAQQVIPNITTDYTADLNGTNVTAPVLDEKNLKPKHRVIYPAIHEPIKPISANSNKVLTISENAENKSNTVVLDNKTTGENTSTKNSDDYNVKLDSKINETLVTSNADNNTATVTSAPNNLPVTDIATPQAPNPIVDKVTTAKKSTTKPNTSKSSWSIITGVNATSSFDQPSYFTGMLWQKTIQDKNLFAGLKVASNRLNHQLLSIDKTGTTPATPDAIINKFTTVQFPFGYEFALNKKATKPTHLMVGFEPTLITGIETIYYDNNGVPGGPTTMVRNSPLLVNAINKFNVSFLVGAQKMLNNKVGIFANAGYGLINITDKQFYNKAGGFNNLKYIQAGLKIKLNK